MTLRAVLLGAWLAVLGLIGVVVVWGQNQVDWGSAGGVISGQVYNTVAQIAPAFVAILALIVGVGAVIVILRMVVRT